MEDDSKFGIYPHGSNWYQNEFKVQTKHNSVGFRDHNRSILKPNGIKRIALLGDSSVSARQSEILKKYCKVNGIGYIPLSDSLNESTKNGVETLWAFDGHLNENGYRIFGEAMFEWIKINQN